MEKSLLSRLLITGFSAALLIAGVVTISVAENKPLSEGKTMSEAQKLLTEADELFNSFKYEDARAIYEKALKAAEDNSDITEATSMIARTYLTTGDKETTAEWLTKAEKTVDLKDKLGWSRYQSVLGRLWWQEKKLVEATQLFEELYNFCSEHNIHDRAIDAARMAAITGTPEQQIIWGKKGIALAEKVDESGLLGPLWNNLGATYEDQKKYDDALDAYLKAREYHWLYGKEINKMIADWAVGHAYRLAGKHDDAQKWLRPVLAWCERIEENEFIGLTCRELGEIDYTAEKNETALAYFLRAEKLLKEAGMDGWDPDGYKQIVDRISQLREKNK
ncbi:MAG: tetratricopeptide repeat protein [FCB group bacterium]|nr:tetratricopeptide repeat protein [FCB group bacterium]